MIVIVAAFTIIVASVDVDDDTSTTGGAHTDTPREDTKTADVRIGWTEMLAPTYYNTLLERQDPPDDDGMQWLIVRYTVANDSVTDGISTKLYGDIEWHVDYDSVRHDSDGDEIWHRDFDGVVVLPGGQVTSVVLFEVPEGKALSDLSVLASSRWDDYTLGYDAALEPEAAVA